MAYCFILTPPEKARNDDGGEPWSRAGGDAQDAAL